MRISGSLFFIFSFLLASSLFSLSVQANEPGKGKEEKQKETRQSTSMTAEISAEVKSDKDRTKLSQVPPGQAGYNNPSIQNPQGVFYQQYNQQPQPPMLPYGQVLVTTTDTVPGYRVVEYKGIVRGDVVFGPTILQAFKSSIKSIIGGKIGGYTQMCQRARQNAFEDMMNQAREVGANAVIGVNYDSSTFSTSNDNDVGTEVFCFGTAVRVVPAR